jgi:antitoxin component YwqK of YwqJK toxin-antitoxin module
MNKILIIFSLVLLASCAPNEVSFGNLVERHGVFYEVNSQTPFTGIVVEYHDNGQLKQKVNLKDGRGDGLYESFHKNGQLESIGNLKDGKQYGLAEWYLENGQLVSKRNYKDGEKDGLSETYYPNGLVQEKGTYKDGILEGKYELYYENGLTESKGVYSDGVLKMQGENIPEMAYREPDYLVYETPSSLIPWSGFVTYYDDKTNKLTDKGNFKDGKHLGLWVSYDAEGRIEREIDYSGEFGLSREYDSKGLLESTECLTRMIWEQADMSDCEK